MIGMRRGATALALSLAAALAGCSDETEEKPGRQGIEAVCDLPGLDSCVEDAQCGAGSGCAQSCCVPTCDTVDDCAGASTCGALGCVCDEGFCRDRVCSATSECDEGLVCEAGDCVQAPSPEDAASCEIWPRYGAVRSGGILTLQVKAYAADGRPLPIDTGYTYESSAAARATVAASSVVSGGDEAGAVTITARLGTASCVAELIAHGVLAEGELRVVAVDELTGLPVEGALVQVEGPATPLTLSTDATGAAVFAADALPAAPRTLSVFHDDFGYVTVVGTGASDLLLPLRRLRATELAGGFQGEIGPESLFTPDDVHAGIVGASIPGNLVDLSFSLLVGPTRMTRVTIGEERDLPLPSGVILGLGNTWFKQEYQALGVPGVCGDRAKMAAGKCGTRAAWGIAGGVPLLDLPIDQLTAGEDNLDAGQLLAQLLPQFRHFRSAVVRNVEFDLHPEVGGDPDWSRFDRLDLQAGERLALRSTLALPELPQAHGGYLDGLIALGGANTPGRGVVPLGITAGVDADTAAGELPDGKINDLEGMSTGQLPLRIAPLHGGLEGSDYAVIALAVNLSGLTADGARCGESDRSGCAAISGVVSRTSDYPFDRTVAFEGGFVGLADDATWDDATRTFAQNGEVEGGPTAMRFKLAGGGKDWVVYYPAGTSGFTLPVPAGIADRAEGKRASVQAMRLSVGLEELIGFDGASLADLVGLTSGFSTVELP